MRYSILALALLTGICLSSCSSETVDLTQPEQSNLSEKVIESFPGGQAKNLVKMLPGTEQIVEQTLFYETGQIHMKGSFQEGKRNGAWETYYTDGKPWSLNTYNTGVLEGPYKAWFENGQIRIEGQYTTGKRSGVWNYYDEVGVMTKSEEL